jgi:hypothetical protein
MRHERMTRSSRQARVGGLLGAALLSVAAGTGTAAAMGAGGASPSNPVKPWVPDAQVDCDWWLSDLDGKSLRASIGRGDDDPVLTINDRGFLKFTESDSPTVTLRADGDPTKAIELTGWVSSDVGGTRMFGVYLQAEARRIFGGATRVEILDASGTLADQMLEATPTQAELDACVRPPSEHSEEESG